MTTAYHGIPVPISGTGSSDTNGLASFRHLRAYRPAFGAPCVIPTCDGHLTMTRVRSSVDGDPTWRESCDTCPYELEL